ncbi:D-tyrosyl-tRNA(Tyr) deacylase [Binucleata daphniae]
MKIVLQRVSKAKVHYNKQLVTQIQDGYVLLVGIEREQQNSTEICNKIVKKILKAKLFNDWCNNIVELEYEILVLSQFTLFGKLKGTKLDFHKAEEHSKAKKIFNELIECFKESYKEDKIKNGLFGKHLEIELTNDGPVTILFDEA